MDSHKQTAAVALPADAGLPINRCNLPTALLGSLGYQRHPQPIELDGVLPAYAELFASLDTIADEQGRAERFMDGMSVYFRLHRLEDAGLDDARPGRGKANYLRLLRGWFFDANGREGAVLKGWVESRFGLVPRFHDAALCTENSGLENKAFQQFQQQRAAGLVGTNALEAQLDLLYTFCQYEWRRRFPGRSHQRLYRGLNRLDEYEVLQAADGHYQLLLNNLNSFTSAPERADEFGDTVIALAVPCTKLLYFPGLLPGRFQGESEHLVIGGLYRAQRVS